MKKHEEPIVVEQLIAASKAATWKALTDVDEMKEWYFPNLPDFQPEIGFQVSFEIENEGRIFVHHWTVTEVVQEERIQYRWRYKNYDGASVATFELSTPEGASNEGPTLVKLTHAAVEDFPDEPAEFRRESGVAGWTWLIQERLKDFLESGSGE